MPSVYLDEQMKTQTRKAGVHESSASFQFHVNIHQQPPSTFSRLCL